MVYIVGGIGGALVLILSVALIVVLSRSPQVAEKPSDLGNASSDANDAGASPEAVADRKPADKEDENPALPYVAKQPTATVSSGDAPETDSFQEASSEGSSLDNGIAWENSTDSNSSLPTQVVDLLERIDPQRDASGGNWSKDGSSLACAGGEKWTLAVPEPPPAGYRWTIQIERTSGDASLGLFLIVDGRPVTAMLGEKGSSVCGLNFVDGQPAAGNDSKGYATVFREDRPTTIECTVDRSSVKITFNRIPAVTWQGSAKRLSYDRVCWRELPTDRLAVVSQRGTGVRIDKMTIEEIDPGEALPLYGEEPSQTASSYGRLLSQPTASLSIDQLPEHVRLSTESVCIIEHPLGSGTGFVVGENLVATNAHVVDGAYVDELVCNFSVSRADKCRVSRVLYEDGVRDLCLLEVQAELPPIPVVADYEFQRGERVAIVGNPALGDTDIVLRDSVTAGTMRAKVHTDQCDYYQIDGAVNPGSSGGPALNFDGAVVAVIAMKATDRGAFEIRQALSELDDSFTGQFGHNWATGIAFGIPVTDLTRAVEEVRQQPESTAMRVGDRHLANVLFQRMSFLSGISLLKLQLNVPPAVRQQAEIVESNIRSGRVPASTLRQLSRVPLPPRYVASKLIAALGQEEAQKIIRASQANLGENIARLSASEQFDAAITRDFEALHRTIQQTQRYAEKPPTTYNAYARAVNDQIKDFKEIIGRLNSRLDVAKAAFEE